MHHPLLHPRWEVDFFNCDVIHIEGFPLLTTYNLLWLTITVFFIWEACDWSFKEKNAGKKKEKMDTILQKQYIYHQVS